jgi:dTDP-4-amino-4,6-dideoxygalactose transaminase
MEFIDLTAQQKHIIKQVEVRIKAVLNHNHYIMGPEVEELEKKLADYVGIKHAIACSSGTDALLMSLMAFDIGRGDAIFTTPFTFIATAEVISLLGATPVFVDIDPKTYNIAPERLTLAIEALKTGRNSDHPLPVSPAASKLIPRGIIAVDLFGLPADYDSIHLIAERNGLFVIEDAAQSFGGVYKGRKACSFGDIACTSFFPAKPLGCYGDGGMCLTENERLAGYIKSLRVHGAGSHKYENVRIGISARLDTIQAAILLAKFEIFDHEVKLRRQVAERYTQYLDKIDRITIPHIPSGYESVWAQYSVLALDEGNRADFQKKLKEASIPTAVYYPKPLHLQPAFAALGYQERDFSISEDCAKRIFSLPMHPYLTEEEQKRIATVMTGDVL